MAEVHQFIIRYGVDAARNQAANKHERDLVEAAYRVLTEDAEKIGFTYRDSLSHLCLISLRKRQCGVVRATMSYYW